MNKKIFGLSSYKQLLNLNSAFIRQCFENIDSVMWSLQLVENHSVIIQQYFYETKELYVSIKNLKILI